MTSFPKPGHCDPFQLHLCLPECSGPFILNHYRYCWIQYKPGVDQEQDLQEPGYAISFPGRDLISNFKGLTRRWKDAI